MKFKQGFFKPQKPEKYKGDPTQIVYRSSYELKLMFWLDSHDSIILWSSENTVIPYISPLDKKPHRYFVDFWIRKIDKNGIQQDVLIEVKPKNQTIEPKKQSKVTKRYLNEVMTWGVNSAKWEAARKYCKQKNMEFMILTEDDLGIKNGRS
jgi:hypothetical protein